MSVETKSIRELQSSVSSELSVNQNVNTASMILTSRMTMTNSEYLKELELFVHEVLNAKQLSFLSVLKSDELNLSTRICEGFSRMHGFIHAVCQLPRQYIYTNCINLFIECCEELQWICDDVFNTRMNIVDFSVQSTSHWISFVRLLDLLFIRGNRSEFQLKVQNAARLIRYRKRHYSSFIKALFDAHSRIIVLRIDFEYHKEIAKTVTLSEALDDLDHLVANMRSNTMFDHMLGYIFKVEYGVDRGIHIHSILFFNGAVRSGAKHIAHAMQIGEYWKNKITQGRGTYWNVNAKIDEYLQKGICGIGLIQWTQDSHISNLSNMLIHYVCKEQQSIRSESEPSRKMIRKQHFPKVDPMRIGRPRVLLVDSELFELNSEID